MNIFDEMKNSLLKNSDTAIYKDFGLSFFNRIRKATLLFILLHITHVSFSQSSDTTKSVSHFSGSVNVTNNGISLIPSFSLGKPAVIINLLMSKVNLSFEPQFRFALEGKPWAFIFWWRYKIIENDKFRFHIGAHPALMFLTKSFVENGLTKEILEARRFIAAEISPSITLTKHISLKPYYLVGHGFDSGD